MLNKIKLLAGVIFINFLVCQSAQSAGTVTGYFMWNMPNGVSLSFPSASAAGAYRCANINNFFGGTVSNLTQIGNNLSITCEGENINGDPAVGNGNATYGTVCLSVDCSGPPPPPPCPNPNSGNPIQTLTGIKTERVVDIKPVSSGMRLERYYSSADLKRANRAFGQQWRHNFEVFLEFGVAPPTFSNDQPENPILLSSCNGYSLKETNNTDSYSFYGSCQPSDNPSDFLSINVHHAKQGQSYFEKVNQIWVAEVNVKVELKDVVNSSALVGWEYRDTQNNIYTFDLQGRLIKQQTNKGDVYTLNYELVAAQGGDDDSATLDTITDQFSNTILLSYTEGYISSVVDPDGQVYRYAYDFYDEVDSTKVRLQYVSLPDDTTQPGSNPFDEDNPYQTYHYENGDTLLTGITDERGVRYVTWTYDPQGRAVTSKHASPTGGDIDLVTLNFSNVNLSTNPYVNETNALNKETKYYFSVIHGVRRINRIDGEPHLHANDGSVSCEASSQYYSYDPNGFLDKVTDWEGNVTDYDHDAKGREIQRVEGLRWDNGIVDSSLLTLAESRTIFTKWHPNFRLPTRTTDPDRVVDMTYDCSTDRLDERKVWALGSEPAYTTPSCP